MRGMGFVDSSASLLATCGGETVKIFDVTVDSGDPCVLSYSPSPGSQVNSVKWNHTNLVVASAGEDKKISLWHKNGESIGSIPPLGTELGDDIEDSIGSISFSNKSSRYLCSGGSGRVVKIWDLQRNLCIKRLSGHTDTVTGVMYNCKDEHLASISMKGDLILHNLASGARAAALKDPNNQVLRVLDYSRLSRHVLLTAGDDGSVHLWDTTGRSPKVSWLKQHSAPTTGACFSPSNDKIIASVGLDKRLYMLDSATRRPTSCTPYEAPFSSLAYSDDGNILAAGTNSGCVVFFDVRGKPQPLTLLRAYHSSQAVVGLSWQRAKPVIVNEKNCTAEIALLGGTSEESAIMPDPLPSLAVSTFHSTMPVPTFRDSSTAGNSESISSTSNLSTGDETPSRNRLWTGGTLSKLHPPRSNYSLKDDMDVFSPVMDVQPITPSLGSWWDDHDEGKKDKVATEKKSVMFSSLPRRFPLAEGDSVTHPISDWRSSSVSLQDDSSTRSLAETSMTSSKSELPFSTFSSEAWGGPSGNLLPDKLMNPRQSTKLSRFSSSALLALGSTFVGLQDSSSSNSFLTKNPSTNANVGSSNQQNKFAFGDSNSSVFSESSSVYVPGSSFLSLGTKTMPSVSNHDISGKVPSTIPRRYSTYSERISTSSSLSDVTVSAVSSPKSKKTGMETREDLVNSLLARQEATVTEAERLSAINVPLHQPTQSIVQSADQQLGTSSFSLQLVQRTLEETLGSVQKAIHEDVRNLHVELLRQFHMQEIEMSSLLSAVLEKQDELMKEVQSLRRENQQLRQLL